MSTKTRTLGLAAVLIPVLLTLAPCADAETLARRQNIVDLIEQADIILRGDVVEVTDGIENNIPYTQVRVKVKQSLRGGVTGTCTFRQFGLLRPRRMPDGRVNYMVQPAGWPSYRANEDVLLFLYRAASRTGLRTTVGLGQGAFAIHGGRAVSQQGNVGLFDGVATDNAAAKADLQLLTANAGPVSAEALLSFVKRAVDGRWVETGRLRNV